MGRWGVGLGPLLRARRRPAVWVIRVSAPGPAPASWLAGLMSSRVCLGVQARSTACHASSEGWEERELSPTPRMARGGLVGPDT
jgi:hypothetical protein